MFFNQIAMSSVKADQWLSRVGLDLTDLPVLTEAFCASDDPLIRDRCAAGLLKAVVRTLVPNSSDFSYGAARSALWDGIDITPAYSELPEQLQVRALREYLESWKRVNSPTPQLIDTYQADGDGGLPSQTAEAAWQYLRGVSAEKVARLSTSTEECGTWLGLAQEFFEKSIDLDRPLFIFTTPASKHLTGLKDEGQSVCEHSK